MIKRNTELHTQIEPSLKNGNGDIKVVDILQPQDMEPNGRLYALTIIPPGGSIGLHQHVGDYETYVILNGEAEINDDGNLYVLGPGDVSICHDGASHSIRNIGKTDLEYIALILYSKTNTDLPVKASK